MGRIPYKTFSAPRIQHLGSQLQPWVGRELHAHARRRFLTAAAPTATAGPPRFEKQHRAGWREPLSLAREHGHVEAARPRPLRTPTPVALHRPSAAAAVYGRTGQWTPGSGHRAVDTGQWTPGRSRLRPHRTRPAMGEIRKKHPLACRRHPAGGEENFAVSAAANNGFTSKL